MAIRLICGERGDIVRFERLARTAGVKNVYETELHIERRGLFSEEVLSQVRAGIKALRWTVAFQVEALHRNLDLDAKEVLLIIPVVRNLVLLKGRSYATAFLRHFATRARFWNAYEETSQSIQDLFNTVHAEYSRSHAKAPSLIPTDNSVIQSLHVIISPTMIYLQGPFVSFSIRSKYSKVETNFPARRVDHAHSFDVPNTISERSNRVLRSFPNKEDSFLRVR